MLYLFSRQFYINNNVRKQINIYGIIPYVGASFPRKKF